MKAGHMRIAAWTTAAGLLLAASGAQAQVQRSFINSSFEEPVLPSNNCYSIREDYLVPGWETTEPTWTGDWNTSTHGTCGGHKSAPPIVGAMQIFKGRQTISGVNTDPVDGSQYAELNAFTPSRLYQEVCLVSGDAVTWSLAHKGRTGTEQMRFNIGTAASGSGSQTIMTATTTTTGTGTVNSCGLGTCGVTSNLSNWARYSGSFTWNGASGLQTVGFQAITGGSVGNLLDDVHVNLKPFVEFATPSGSDAEAGGGNVPQIVVSGSFAAPTPITINVVGGTGVLGTDYTTPSGTSSFQVIIPAGQYAGTAFPIGVEVVDDVSTEDDETIIFELDASSPDYTVLSTQTCGAPATASSTYTILDDDIEADLSITKDDGSTIYTPGNNVVYTIVVSNNGPFGVQNAQVVDALPTGVTSATWICGAATSGGVCGAASGSGAINTTADLPANSSVTYTLTLFVPSTFSGNLVNTATVTAPAGTADPDTSNNSASDTDTQFPAPAANVANLSCTSDASLLNTAYDGAGGRLTSGTDMHWQVALTTTPITGAPPAGLSYNAATVVTNPPANYMVSPYNNASWISHAANTLHPTSVNYDIFYRYQLNLGPGTDPSVLAPRLDFYSDNSVIEIWINGVAQGVQSNYGAADPYLFAGFTAANPAQGTLVGPWKSGFNEIVVHIKSGAPAQAFLAQVVLPQSICEPATITLNKTTRLVAGGPFGFGLTNTAQATGSVSTTAVDTPTPVDGDTSSAGTAEPFLVTAFGSDVVITESNLPSGWRLSDAVCTSGGTPIGTRSGSSYTIPGSLIDASAENFACTFVNDPTTNLRIAKTANPTTARPGDTVTYTLALDNDGPGPGDGAVLRDPAVAGVDCSAATLTCSAASGAVCPASLDVTALQGTGLAIPTFPVGGSLQFGMTCTVTATGY